MGPADQSLATLPSFSPFTASTNSSALATYGFNKLLSVGHVRQPQGVIPTTVVLVDVLQVDQDGGGACYDGDVLHVTQADVPVSLLATAGLGEVVD